MVRKFLAGCVAAVVAGVLMGAVSRALMALVALAAGDRSEFSWVGTAGIIAIYVAVMVPGALLAAATRHWGRWLLAAAGAVFLAFPAVGIAGDEVGGTAHLSTMQWVGVSAAGLAAFATIAVLPLLTVRLVDQALGRRSRGRHRAVRKVSGRPPLLPPATSG